MGEALNAAGAACGVIAVAELLGRLAPKDKVVGFVRSLTVLVVLVSMAASFMGRPLTLPEYGEVSGENPQLESCVAQRYAQAAREDYRSYIEGLLAAGGLQAKKISVNIDIMEDSSIELTEAAVWFQYESDAQRARALLTNALGEGTAVEVYLDGA